MHTYDSDVVSHLYDLSSINGEHRFRIHVSGMNCSSCVHRLEQLSHRLPGVLEARVDFAQSQMWVTTNLQVRLSEILSTVKEMGYEGRPLQTEESNQEIYKKEDREALKRIGVAGACAGNIMLFTVPIYGGLEGGLAEIFKVVSLILFLPILLYSAVPFYKSAWNGLKVRTINVDLPLTIALWFGFIASVVNYWRGEGGIYFDSSAGFLFLILIARWFMKVSQRKWTESPLAHLPWKNDLVMVHIGDQKKWEPAFQIANGMTFELERGQVVPVDSTLISIKSSFDTSWMTGESNPKVVQKGMSVPAGYRCLESGSLMLAKENLEESSLTESLKRAEVQSLSSSRKLTLFDRAAQNLLVSVFIVGAVLVCVGPWLGLSYSDSFERALSLLIVACPCALAFGGPLAYGMALRKAAAAGILLKNADVLDRVLECESIIFDKTGTLTEGKLKLVSQTPVDLPEWIKALVLSLEKESTHPIANAFRSAWLSPNFQPLVVHDVHEIVGERIIGVYGVRMYSIEAATSSGENGIEIALKQDGQELARFVFDDRIRSESQGILKTLSKTYDIGILSGDRLGRVQSLLKNLNLDSLWGRGDCSPSEKASLVARKNPCLMVGDGLNDVEALSVAHVGISMNGAIEHGVLRGSGYFLKPGLAPVMTLLECARCAQTLMRRNLTFALVYNLIAGTAALLGMVNPLVAALLMPISSLLLIFSTWMSS